MCSVVFVGRNINTIGMLDLMFYCCFVGKNDLRFWTQRNCWETFELSPDFSPFNLSSLISWFLSNFSVWEICKGFVFEPCRFLKILFFFCFSTFLHNQSFRVFTKFSDGCLNSGVV